LEPGSVSRRELRREAIAFYLTLSLGAQHHRRREGYTRLGWNRR
jgi:hypothetical protein